MAPHLLLKYATYRKKWRGILQTQVNNSLQKPGGHCIALYLTRWDTLNVSLQDGNLALIITR
ncbi:hypothetical protein [Ferruginibacter sp.]|uniref:hypothetical protein n=1 Tax=Ferruginibacter sp. TaxID=1940288 RepID=UPI002658CC54|nr:hypothetical protein [Ferruginibacter sp.]